MAVGVEASEDFGEFEIVSVHGQELRAKDQFSFLPEATTDEDKVELSTPAWFRRIARGAFAQFIREFFDGKYRDRLIKLAPGTAINFTTLSGDRLNQDKDKRFLQLARKMAQLFQKLPCILVTDTGENIIPSGLGYYDRQDIINTPKGGKVAVRTRSRVAQVPLEIIVASRDEDSADELADVIGIIIENRNVVGSLISGENWEVRLPHMWSPGSRSTQPIGEDPIQTFGMVSISAEVGVEVWWYEKSEADFKMDKVSCGNREGRQFVYKPKTSLNSRYSIRLNQYPAGTIVYSKNSNIVIVSGTLEVIPIKMGSTTLVARSPRDEIVDEFPISITLT
jgi:hypothetical protein